MRKTKSELIKKALKNVADMHGISVEEVEREIEKALKAVGRTESAEAAVEMLVDKSKERITGSGN